MQTSPDFADHCLDLFAGLGPVEARSMFGGHAFFLGPAMFAIGDADEWRVWLKVDDATKLRFEAAGGVAFTYTAKGRPAISMSFFTVPDAAMEHGEAMLPWARLALEAAGRAAARRKPKAGARSKGGAKPKGGGSVSERRPRRSGSDRPRSAKDGKPARNGRRTRPPDRIARVSDHGGGLPDD